MPRSLAVAALVVGLVTAGCSATVPPASGDSDRGQASPQPSPPSPAPPTGPTAEPPPAWTGHPAEGLAFVAFPVDNDPTTQVYIVEADGTRRQVTGVSGSSGASFPVWSPDGSQLVFNDPKVGGGIFGQVALVNADGSDERLLGEGRDHRWSPDGTRIVFGESDPVGDEDPSIFLLDVASEEVTEIGIGATPEWLPDGERISFTRTVDLGGGMIGSALFIMPVDGGEAEEVARETAAVWSVAGNAVLLVSEGVISIASADDLGGAREIANGYGPVWAPDGRSFVFGYDTDADANPVLAIVDTVGDEIVSGFVGSRPTWSPDGTRIAVEVYAEEMPIIQVIEVATGQLIWEAEGMQPAWRP